jgi:hypothetical protein
MLAAPLVPDPVIPLFGEVPDFDAILPLLISAIKNAKQIPSKPPMAWGAGVISAWDCHLQGLTGVLRNAVATPTPVALFNAVFHFCCTPGILLAPRFRRSADGGKPHRMDSIDSALRKIQQGQERKAFKLLCSNGVATVTDEVVDVLREMHPKLTSPLVPPQARVTQAQVDYCTIHDRLFRDSGDINISKDVYGWTPSLFMHVRGVADGFLNALSNFVLLLTNNPHLFPQACAKMLSAGFLTPLHKLSIFEQKDRADLNLKPKIRPVNCGTLIAKVALGAMLETPAAVAAAAKTQPFQLSLGTKRGVEKLIHICRAAYHKGYLIGRNDFANGFNSLSRQKMLDAHNDLFPEATSLFNFFYGSAAPVFLLDDHDDLIQLSSEQGSRQGCAAGCEGFCLAITNMLFKLQSKYQEFEFRVVVDDIIPIVPPPLVNDYDGWQATFRRYATFLIDLKEMASELAGLGLNVDKGGLLIPAGAPQPSDEVRALFDAGFEFQVDGFRIGGAPIGTLRFMQTYVSTRVTEAISKVRRIVALGKSSARAAHRLLISCATKLLTFMAATVPPDVCAPYLLQFDSHIQDAFLEILQFEMGSCSQKRYERAVLRLSLPAPHGCNLFKVSDFASVAWWASVAYSLSDPLLFKLRHGLNVYADAAFERLQGTLGGSDARFWTRLCHLFPPNADGLLNGLTYSPSHPISTKFNRIYLRSLKLLRLSYFQGLTGPESVDEYSFTSADLVNAAARTDAGMIFATPLRNSMVPFRFEDQEYRAYCLFFLGLPPMSTVGNAARQEGYDYPVQKCLANHGVNVSPLIDAGACHASSNCPATYAGRAKKHKNLIRVLTNAATEAGLKVQPEPDSCALLLGEFSKQECRRIFPKAASVQYKRQFDILVELMNDVDEQKQLTLSEKHAIIQKQISQLPRYSTEDATGLRLDLTVEDVSNGDAYWLDATTVHTSSPSYLTKEKLHSVKRLLSTDLAAERKLPDLMLHDPSPTLVEREKQKCTKYSRLVLVAQRQCKLGRRAKAPMFSPFVVADTGELGPAASDFISWLTLKYKRHHKGLVRTDGRSLKELLADFRFKLKVSLQIAVASGLGAMILSAGQPWWGAKGR